MFPGDLNHLIETVGYIGIFLIIFAETGLLMVLSAGATVCFSPPDFWHRRTS